MSRFSIQFNNDFSFGAVLAGWLMLSLMPGIMVWVLGIHVPHWEYFPAPMARSTYHPGSAYASLVSSMVVGVLASLYLPRITSIYGVNPFWRCLALSGAIACLAFLAVFNPFVTSNYVGRIALEVLAILDWVLIAFVGTITSFLFALLVTIGISSNRG